MTSTVPELEQRAVELAANLDAGEQIDRTRIAVIPRDCTAPRTGRPRSVKSPLIRLLLLRIGEWPTYADRHFARQKI